VSFSFEDKWSKDDPRCWFVAGAKWWEFHKTGATMWQSDQRLAEAEASQRYASQQADSVDAKKTGRCKWCGYPSGYYRDKMTVHFKHH